MIIRPLKIQELDQYWELISKISLESNSLIVCPINDRHCQQSMLEFFKDVIENQKAQNGLVLVAMDEFEMIGFLYFKRGNFSAIRHRGELTMGVLASVRGQGLGMALLNSLKSWARQSGVSRLELSVVADNTSALQLYHKFGFHVEGQKHQAIRRGTQFTDGIAMALCIDSNPILSNPIPNQRA